MNTRNLLWPGPSVWPAIPALLLCLVSASVAHAATGKDDRASISLGVFVTDRDTNTRIDANTNEPGSDVDLEADLGLDKSDSVFRFDGYFKFNDRHRIDASWFDLSRSATKEINREIVWNGTVYPLDTTVESIFDLAIYKIAYTYSFLRREEGFLGASAGLYIADFGATLSAPGIGERETEDATAPLPVFGLRGEYRISRKWTFRGSGEFFAFEYEDWDGTLVDLYVGIDYAVSDAISLGLGYNSVTFDLGVDKTNFSGDVDWGYSGGMIFLKYDF